jgi:hypothetical protein
MPRAAALDSTVAAPFLIYAGRHRTFGPMPELSRFFGIIIRMFSEPSKRHRTAHFQRLIEAWAELHQDELLADWKLLQEGKRPAPIDPLR